MKKTLPDFSKILGLPELPEKPVIFDEKTGTIWVSKLVYLHQIAECYNLFLSDLSKILSSKPNGWRKIRNLILRYVEWVSRKNIQLNECAEICVSYLKERKQFENILGQYTPEYL